MTGVNNNIPISDNLINRTTYEGEVLMKGRSEKKKDGAKRRWTDIGNEDNERRSDRIE
jgi:hypothetical protein